MAFPDDLLELAQDLRSLHSEGPHQASLRRAVSTAYYALFHLLISEATANWARPELRVPLSKTILPNAQRRQWTTTSVQSPTHSSRPSNGATMQITTWRRIGQLSRWAT